MNHKKLSIAFRLNGGIGTYIAELNYIQYLFDAFSDVLSITVFGASSQAVNCGLMENQYFIDQYYLRSEYTTVGYDLVVDINWFPKVSFVNQKRLEKVSQKFAELVAVWQNFEHNFRTKDFVRLDSVFDPNIYNYAIVNGKNKLTIMDIGDCLGIRRDLKFSLAVYDEASTLEHFDLQGKQYITMQQGVNAQCLTMQSPKQWPTGYYSELCKLLKERYPEIVLVQLGETGNNVVIEGVDLCLLGETTFEELKVLLKYAYLHVDGDCGMVHIRKALHTGPSIVLYGQIPQEVHGYDDDICLKSNVCKGSCAKLYASWKRKCYLSDSPKCMTSILPEVVFDKITKYMDNGLEAEPTSPTKLDELLADTNILLDKEWVDNWLSKREIYGYWLERVKISDLIALKLTAKGYIRVPITEMPAYQHIAGDKKSYTEYMQLNAKYNPNGEHSVARFEALVESLKQVYKEKCCIVVDGTNRILDGVHRASSFAYQRGLDSEITVLKIYGDWEI